MKTLFFIVVSVSFFFFSCGDRPIPDESSFIFQLPQSDVFVKTSKYKGGRFTVFFALDSLSLSHSKDSIGFRINDDIHIVVDTTYVYISSWSRALSLGSHNFDFEIVSDSVFSSFFENGMQKQSYSYIKIDAKWYSIRLNKHLIKEGNVYGGW